jgi:SnoaL-like domain
MDERSKLPGLEAMPHEDQKAIGATMSALLGGFSKRDPAMLEAVYSDDADWVNAFGTVRTGRAEIVAYLRGLFADANFDAGKLVPPREPSAPAQRHRGGGIDTPAHHRSGPGRRWGDLDARQPLAAHPPEAARRPLARGLGDLHGRPPRPDIRPRFAAIGARNTSRIAVAHAADCPNGGLREQAAAGGAALRSMPGDAGASVRTRPRPAGAPRPRQ